MLQDIDSEGNLCNITQTNPIDISTKPDVIEHVHVGKNCSIDESEAYKALFKEFRDIFPGLMKRCQGLTLPLWSTRLKLIPRLNLSGRNLGKSILGKPQLLKLRLRNFWKLVFFILYLWQNGYRTLSLSIKSRAPLESVSILENWIKLVPRTTFLLHISIRLSTTVLEVSYFHSWMASLAIIRLIYCPPISIKQHSCKFEHIDL